MPKIGEKFDHQNPFPGYSSHSIRLNETFFDVVIYEESLSEQELSDFKSNEHTIFSFYYEETIPFFLVDFGSWSIAPGINIRSIIKGKELDRWLEGSANTVNIFLVDAYKSILIAKQTIEIQTAVALHCRSVLKGQLAVYSSAQEIIKKLMVIAKKTSGTIVIKPLFFENMNIRDHGN